VYVQTLDAVGVALACNLQQCRGHECIVIFPIMINHGMVSGGKDSYLSCVHADG
jgi:hypothetical protein